MTIYIDTDYKCHTSDPDGTLTAVETDFFDGKCAAYVEGYRFIPSGKNWTCQDGVVFHGEMVSPWKDWQELDAVQRDYEQKQLTILTTENLVLVSDMAQMVDEIYQSDIETLGI